jgi:peroxiredoxin
MQKIGIIIVAVIALALGVMVQKRNSILSTHTQINLHTITLPDLEGTKQRLSQWQGKILVINFWATWCPPCLTEIPDFMALQTQYQAKNVQFIGIAVDDDAAVKSFQLKMQVNYPLLMASHSGMALAHSWGNLLDVVPFTVVINPQGEIIHRKMGEFSQKALQKVIESLLDQQPP